MLSAFMYCCEWLALYPLGVPLGLVLLGAGSPRSLCSSFPALGRSAELLGLDPTQLTDALTQRSMFLRGEEILTPLSVQQVHALCYPGWI